MGQRRTIELGDVSRGLNDFPESAPRGSASEALNVTFDHGGVATRRGVSFTGSVSGHDANKSQLLIKGFWCFPTTTGEEYFILVWMYGDGDRVGQAVMSVFDSSGENLGYRRFKTAGDVLITWEVTPQRWSGTAQVNAGETSAVFLIGTEQSSNQLVGGNSTNHLWVVKTQVPEAGQDIPPLSLNRLLTKDRNDGINDVDPFWGVEHPFGPDLADDTGPYIKGQTVGGPVMTRHGERLATNVANLTNRDGAESYTVRFSNLGDRRGWPLNNYQFIDEKSPGPVTGMAEWEGRLVVFTEDTLSTVRFDSQVQVHKNLVVNGNGCVSHGTVQNISHGGGNWVFWLGYDGVYAWSGGSTPEQISAPIAKRFASSDFLQPGDFVEPNINGFEGLDQPWSFNWKEKNQYWLVLAGQNSADKALVFDYKRKSWSIVRIGGRPHILGMAKSPKRGTKPFIVVSGAHGDRTKIRVVKADTEGYVDTIDSSGEEHEYHVRWVTVPIIFGGNFVYRWRYFRPTMSMAGDRNENTTRDIVWMFDNELLPDQKKKGVTGYPEHLQVFRMGDAFGAAVMGTPRDWTTRVDLFAEASSAKGAFTIVNGGPSRTIKIGFDISKGNRPFHLLRGELDVIDRGTRR